MSGDLYTTAECALFEKPWTLQPPSLVCAVKTFCLRISSYLISITQGHSSIPEEQQEYQILENPKQSAAVQLAVCCVLCMTCTFWSLPFTESAEIVSLHFYIFAQYFLFVNLLIINIVICDVDGIGQSYSR